jgi:hypothetical protein
MLDVVHRYGAAVRSGSTVYHASAYAERQDDGTWHGYLVFTPAGGGRTVVTPRETTQSRRDALSYWAGGISPVYLEGALERAIALQPEVQLERRLEEIARLEADARAEVANLERAAAAARAVANLTERQREETARALADARAEAADEAARLIRSRRGDRGVPQSS